MTDSNTHARAIMWCRARDASDLPRWVSGLGLAGLGQLGRGEVRRGNRNSRVSVQQYDLSLGFGVEWWWWWNVIAGRTKSREVAVQVLRLDVYDDDGYVLYLLTYARATGVVASKSEAYGKLWRVRCMPSPSYAGAKCVVFVLFYNVWQ